MKDTNELKWNKTYRYGCSTYAGTQYTADSLLHHYVIDVIGNKASGQEFILNISTSVPGRMIDHSLNLLEYTGKSITQLKNIAGNYHAAVRAAVAKSAAGGGRQDVRSLFNFFKEKYHHIIHRRMMEHPMYMDTTRDDRSSLEKVRDLEKGVFVL